jgi:Mg2+/Co2+ transporter CorB
MIPADGRVAMLAIKENLLLRVVVNIVYFLPQRTRVEDALSLFIVCDCLFAVVVYQHGQLQPK